MKNNASFDPFKESGLVCKCGGSFSPSESHIIHHGKGRYRYSGLTTWWFKDRVDYPAKCDACDKKDILIHFVGDPNIYGKDEFILKSKLNANLYY